MANFWKLLPKSFLVLAPMEDVTDVVFREIVAKELARPDVFFTEFTSADGLFSEGRAKTIPRFKYSEKQRPIVAQIWGKNPENLYKAAQLVHQLKFDGIDINMACPDKAVLKKGCGGALIQNQTLAKQSIEAVREGSKDLPVSVKTRLGFDSIITEEWVTFLLRQKIDALTIHGRTVTQMSKGEANWDEIGKAVKIKNKIAPETVLIGNGDVKSFEEALVLNKKYGVEGIMIGRGIFSNPWVFERTVGPQIHSKEKYIKILLKHLALHDQTWGDTKHFDTLKKFFKMYIKNFAGANELRQKLMECKNSSEVRTILKLHFETI